MAQSRTANPEALAELIGDGTLTRATVGRLAMVDASGDVERATSFLSELIGADEARAVTEAMTPHPDTPVEPTPHRARRVTQIEEGRPLPGFDRYRLSERLGAGGMGEVWLAEDRVLRRHVALKVLRETLNARADVVERFVYEARATGVLEHPGVIAVHDAGTLDDGRWFYTMQRIGGRNLHDVLRALRHGDVDTMVAWPLQRLLDVFSRVCLTVAYAHAHGFIHRDLKPENILLGAFGEVYVADWGLAKCFDPALAGVVIGEDPDVGLPQGVVLGTAGYMAHEQIAGHLRQLGPPADCYALACILFEILSLRLPFVETDLLALAVRMMREHPPDPAEVAPERDVPWKMAQLCLEGLERDPARRPDARSFADRTASFLDGVEEQRRRAELASERLADARRLRTAWADARADLAQRQQRYSDRLAAVSLDAPYDRRVELWRHERALDRMRHEVDDMLSQATQAASQALSYRDDDDAHAVLADLYAQRLMDAEAANDASSQQFFRALVREHDRGAWSALLSDTGSLSLQIGPADATVNIVQQVPLGPTHSIRPVEYVPGLELPVGSYVATIEAPQHITVEYPFVIRGARETVIDVTLPRSFPGSEYYAFVAGGPAVLGGDSGARASLPRQTVDVPGVLMGRHPVTMEEYVEFLNAVAARDFARARSHAPRTTDGRLWVQVDESAQRFSVFDVDEHGDVWSPRWPAMMISWFDASAFCEWRSARDGATIRLPNELEWEKAARGADARVFPWGNGFDPTLCRMGDSAQGRSTPVDVDAYPHDRSPWGVRHLAGLVLEWTGTVDPVDPERRIMRGGGFFSPEPWCRAASRKSNEATTCFIQFGFRIVREL